MKSRVDSAGVPERFEDARLDNFSTKTAELKKAHDNATVLVKNIDAFISNNWGLFLDGPPSQGKTQLQSAIINELCIEQDYDGIMVKVSSLLSELKAAVGDNRLNEVLEVIRDNRIIALNDITGGKRPEDTFTPFERGIIYDLVDAVYEKQKVIIISSKFNYEWIQDKLGQDVRDRLQEMCGEEVTIKGYNWRRKAGKKRDRKVRQMIKVM